MVEADRTHHPGRTEDVPPQEQDGGRTKGTPGKVNQPTTLEDGFRGQNEQLQRSIAVFSQEEVRGIYETQTGTITKTKTLHEKQTAESPRQILQHKPDYRKCQGKTPASYP